MSIGAYKAVKARRALLSLSHTGNTKPRGAGDRFGDYLCVDFANLPCATGLNDFINTKFTRHITKMFKSMDQISRLNRLRLPKYI